MPKVKNLKLSNPIEKHFNVISRYHYYFFVLIFTSKLPIFWHVLNLIFLSPPMEYYCNSTTISHVTYSKNHCPCEKPAWNRSVFKETMQTKFNLVCDKAWIISFSQSITYVGTLIGSLLFGFLSDKYVSIYRFRSVNNYFRSQYIITRCDIPISYSPSIE